MSFFGTFGALLEDPKRIDDYSIFTFPRIVEGLWFYIKKRTNLKDINDFPKYLFSVLMAIIFILRKYYSNEVPSHYLKQFEFFFGK